MAKASRSKVVQKYRDDLGAKIAELTVDYEKRGEQLAGLHVAKLLLDEAEQGVLENGSD